MASRALARPVIIRMPSRARRAARRVVHVARRGGRAVRRSLPTVGLALGGAAVGFLKGSGRLDFLPEVAGSKMVSLGIAGYAMTRLSRNQHIRSAGLAALIVAAYDFGNAQGGGVQGDDEWGWPSRG